MGLAALGEAAPDCCWLTAEPGRDTAGEGFTLPGWDAGPRGRALGGGREEGGKGRKAPIAGGGPAGGT